MTAIDVQLTTSDSLSDALLDLERQAPHRVLRGVARDIIPPLDRQLDRILRQPAPPRGSATFVWSPDPAKNARARAWWFANLAEGNITTDGAHYQRSGQMPQAWETDIMLVGGVVQVSAVNEDPDSSFVYGSEAFDQVPGHRQTGWPYVVDLVEEIGIQLENDVEDMWYRIVEEM